MIAVQGMVGPGVWCLSGNPGCGKTFAAHLWAIGEGHHRGGRIVTASAFARMSRYPVDGAPDKFETFAEPERLVIDDMGVEYADQRGSFLADIDELINLRWSSERGTLITTNLSMDEFKERYEERIADRIRDRGGWVNVGAESLRGQR
jgi:DNA replication protein DnaC